MQKYLKQSMEFIKSEGGASSAEYALLSSLIAAVALVAITALGISLSNLYQYAVDTLPFGS
jgi:Flp pilus assembly pilin Flp